MIVTFMVVPAFVEGTGAHHDNGEAVAQHHRVGIAQVFHTPDPQAHQALGLPHADAPDFHRRQPAQEAFPVFPGGGIPHAHPGEVPEVLGALV
jgi:hypothetical protein